MDEALSFVKKSQKTPQKEIIKAEEIRKKYFELKQAQWKNTGEFF